MITLIAAMSSNRVIGQKGELPWSMPNDMKFFMDTTKGHPVIMGRKTFESLGRPLKNRTNIIITRNKNYRVENCIITSSIEEALKIALNKDQEVYVIGGEEIYKLALPFSDQIMLTEIETIVSTGDAFFPNFTEEEWRLVDTKPHKSDANHAFDYKFLKYLRKSPPKAI